LLYDALNMRFRELKLRKDPNLAPITELIDYQQFCGLSRESEATSENRDEPFGRISVHEFALRREKGWRPFVLDVRKPHEAEIAVLGFADLLQPHEQVAAVVDRLPRDRDIVIHCKSGGRSAQAAQRLAELGFSRLHNLEGGLNAWAKEIDGSIARY
jgi:adenylyltransferase/sulfurtransferase